MKKTASILFFLTPVAVFAFDSLQELIPALGSFITSLIPIAFGIGFLVFFWGLARFIFNAGDEKKVEEGKRLMVWGVIALFVMASIWGIVALFRGNLGIQDINTI